jgi:hypothetical protein
LQSVFSKGAAMTMFWLRQDSDASDFADHVMIALNG